MTMAAGPIETNPRLFIAKKDKEATESVLPDLLSFTYTENETNAADEIGLVLKDPDGKWAGSWSPDGGESIWAYLSSGTTTDGGLGRSELFCGRFYVDLMRVSGSPRIFDLRAVSIPLNAAIRKKIKTKAWEGKTLKYIADEKAKAAGVTLVYRAEDSPFYERVDQSAESDLMFLSRLCQEAGLSLKLTDDEIVIFDQRYYESLEPSHSFTLGEDDILSWSFDAVQSETYRSCTVAYRDPKKKQKWSAGSNDIHDILAGNKEDGAQSGDIHEILSGDKKKTNPAVMSYTAVDETVDANGQEFVMKRRATSIAEAKRLAAAKLRELNLRRVTGSMTVLGDVTLRAGDVVKCAGFGSFNGNFFIEQATHSVSTRGYTTSLRLRRVNNNY